MRPANLETAEAPNAAPVSSSTAAVIHPPGSSTTTSISSHLWCKSDPAVISPASSSILLSKQLNPEALSAENDLTRSSNHHTLNSSWSCGTTPDDVRWFPSTTAPVSSAHWLHHHHHRQHPRIASESIPITKTVQRAAFDVQQQEEEALAEYRDFVMYQRISRRDSTTTDQTLEPSSRQLTSSLPFLPPPAWQPPTVPLKESYWTTATPPSVYSLQAAVHPRFPLLTEDDHHGSDDHAPHEDEDGVFELDL